MSSASTSRFAGKYRLDVLIFITYQLCHAMSTQQLFPVLLNYTPPIACFGTRCTEVKEKCYEECQTCPDVCANETSHQHCMENYRPYFLSAAMEYKIYCHSFYRAVSATSLQYAGVLIGNLFVGYLADKYGRRFVLLIALSAGIPELFLSGVIVSIPIFYLLRFLVGISVAGTMSIGWTYCSEMISAQHRLKLRTITSYSLGRVVMVGLSQLAGEWRMATYLHASLCCCTLLLVLLLPESIIWLRRTDDSHAVEKAARKIARINGTSLSTENADGGKTDNDQETVRKCSPEASKQNTSISQLSLFDVLRSDSLRGSFIVLSVMWFSCSLSEYLIDLNGEDMSKNIWVGQYMSGALASLTRLIVGVADGYIPWLGRRKVFLTALGVCVLAVIALLSQLYLGGRKGDTLYLVTYLIAYNAVALSWEPNFVCASELMPTDVRAKTTAFLSILSRVGSVIASAMIILKTLYEPAIMWTVLASNLAAFVVALRWLQESKNCDLEAVGLLQKSPQSISMAKVTPTETKTSAGFESGDDPSTSKGTQGSSG